jgi:hypothetical protein
MYHSVSRIQFVIFNTDLLNKSKNHFKMFKLVVLSCLVSVAFAGYVPATIAQVKQYVEPQTTIVETPTIQHVGTAYKNIPTGVSHHSSSVVHSHASIVEPVYAHGVDKQIISTPIVKKVVEHVPAKIVAEPIYAKQYVAAPQYIAAPQQYYAKSVVAAPLAYSSPLTYSSAYVQPKLAYAASYPSAYASYAVPAASYAHHW